jgi:hypothetical protein
MILTHGANSLKKGGGGQYITIDGIDYPYIEYTSQLGDDYKYKVSIITKNLKMNVPNKTKFIQGEEWRGAYYYPQACIEINAYCNKNGLTGWHVPTVNEGNKLFTTASKYLNDIWVNNVNNDILYPFISDSQEWTDLGATDNQYRNMLQLEIEPNGALYGDSPWHGFTEGGFWVTNDDGGAYTKLWSPTYLSESSFGHQTYLALNMRLIKLETI